MFKLSETLPQRLGQFARLTGSLGGANAPAVYKGWGGPVTGAAIKGLAIGLPTYYLARKGLEATGKDKDWDAHRTALLTSILAGTGAAGMDIHSAISNLRDAPGGYLNKLQNVNKDPGTFMPKDADYNGSLRNPNAPASGEGGNWNERTRQDDPVSAIAARIRSKIRGSQPVGDMVATAATDSGGPVKPHPEMISNKIVKDAIARATNRNGVRLFKEATVRTARWRREHPRSCTCGKLSDVYYDICDKCQGVYVEPKEKKADMDYNTSGAFADYDTFLPPGYQQSVPAHYTLAQIDNDPYLAPNQKAIASMHIMNASGGQPGLITVNRLTQAAVGAGIGYASATLFGKVIGGIFGGLAPVTQRRLQQAGTVAGLLVNTGAI